MFDDHLVDPALVREQLGGLSEGTIGRIVAAFEADLAALRPRLLDPEQHAAARHELKGLAGNFGAAHMIAVAGAVPAKANALDRAIARTIQAVRALA